MQGFKKHRYPENHTDTHTVQSIVTFSGIGEKMDGRFHWDAKGKVISRTSSMGCSSRSIYYCRKAEGVPFQWEMKPGKPKDPPPHEEILPPLSPPPAILSMGLPKPCIEQPKPPSWIRLRFWKRSRKSKDSKRSFQARSLDYSNEDHFTYCDNKLERFSFFSSDCEFMASSCDSTTSLSLSSSSSSSSSLSSLIKSLNVRNRGGYHLKDFKLQCWAN